MGIHGEPDEVWEKRIKELSPYKVTKEVMANAKDSAIFLHCLPAFHDLTHEDIVQNMLAGNYYSSSGPEIRDWGIRDNVAYVDCSPVYRIDFVAGNDINDGISRVCGSYDDTIEHGEYELKGHETYVRVKTDKNGKIGLPDLACKMINFLLVSLEKV